MARILVRVTKTIVEHDFYVREGRRRRGGFPRALCRTGDDTVDAARREPCGGLLCLNATTFAQWGIGGRALFDVLLDWLCMTNKNEFHIATLAASYEQKLATLGIATRTDSKSRIAAGQNGWACGRAALRRARSRN